MAKTQQPKNTEIDAPETFEKAMHELEELVARMDEPELGLDGLLNDYKRGAQLVKYCRDRLAAVKVEMQQVDEQLQNLEDDS